ncbi:MAG: hypothetical protein JO021_20165, partial [Alphaproteobacteria bacterium]|nr:hypothetical protein [Alphaproteobacteria bacterium]
FKALLFRYTGQTDLLVGGVADTRRRPEHQSLMGCFLNGLALRSRPALDMRFVDYLLQVRDVVLGAEAAADVPFDRVVRAVQPRHDPTRHPLFQIVFSMQPPLGPLPAGWDLTRMDVSAGTAKVDLHLELEERTDRILARVIYSTELFETDTIQRLSRDWLTLLQAAAADPTVTLGQLPVMSPTADQRVIAPTPVDAAQVRRTRFVPPTTSTERRLAALWQDVLEIPSVSVEDNFFDLGGHSLLVARLVRRVELGFGRRLDLADIFRAPTLARMAALLDAAAAPSSPRIMPIQPSGTSPPLLWLAPEPSFLRLARALAPRQPFIGVRLEPDDVRHLAFPSPLPVIARLYVDAIRAYQPNGPYYLGGWCVWGAVAVEVATQLVDAGETVGLVVLLHAVNPVQYRRTSSLTRLCGKVRYHVGQMIRQPWGERWSYLQARSKAAVQEVVDLPQDAASGTSSRFAEILQQAAVNHTPKPYPGAVALFQPASRPVDMDFSPGWLEVVRGEFASFDVPSSHWSMVEPANVDALGTAIGDALSAVQAGRRLMSPPSCDNPGPDQPRDRRLGAPASELTPLRLNNGAPTAYG